MRLRRLLGRTLGGALGADLGLRLTPPTRGRVGPLEVEVALRPASSGVEVDLRPLGTARLATHGGPLGVTLRARDLDPAALAPLAAGAVAPQLAAWGHDARPLAVRAAITAAAGATLGGVAAGALLTRRPRDAVSAGGVALALTLGAGARGVLTRDASALRDPRLTGLLQQAPRILGDLRTAPQRLDRYRDQLTELLQTAAGVYERVAALPDAPPEDAIRLVHISDIHLSPLGLPLARAAVAQYGAHLVVDTGDLVDWGTPAERATLRPIADLGVPYVYVKGNHDSTGTAAAVAEQPNAVVLDGATTPVEVAGLRFVGLPDPRFTPDKTTGHDRAHDLPATAATAFAERLRAAGTAADIALVHSPAAGRKLAGLVPLVLSGDTHVRAARALGGTLLLTQGTTGGAGLRGVQTDPPPPFALSVLHLDRRTKRLHTVDELTLDGLGGTGASVRRRRVGDLVAPVEAR
ncbi:MAG: metallophosphoesterase family protein [Jatrophihabitans sp.]|uniref:metallophosphoesterase family protein n=1 Tax=Jatrophihabitans sp. TaxID=1932789 RepID=UPI003F7CFBE7